MGISRKGTVRQAGPIVSRSSALGVATSGKLKDNTTADAKTAKLIGTAPTAKGQQKQNSDRFSSTSGSGGTGSSTGSMQLGGISLNIDLEPLMSGMNYGTDDIHLYEVYRDMYFFDPIAGGIVDLQSTLPFSAYTFGGAKDSILEPFYEVNQGLKLESMLPLMSIDRQVTGTHVSSIIFNRDKKQFLDLMTHRMDNIEATPIPFLSHDPILELNVPEELKKAMAHASPRIQKLKEMLGSDLVNKFEEGKIELDATGTIYCPRKCFTYGEGVSYYRRILPIWLIEKNLYRGTLIESGRRQRGILHAQMGDGGEWEPSIDEMEYITDLLLSADADPIGSVIATRLGVNINEFRQGGDFWKVSDFWDQAGAMKMKALGVSDAFLSGDATFANGDTGLSVFMESLRSFRDQITRNVFYEKIFPLVSVMNGLTVNRNGKVVVSNMIKGDYNEIMGRMRDGSRLFIPQVHWSKQLHPDSNQAAMDSLRAMQELGIPVGLRAIAAAGGFNLEQLLTDVDENIAYERKVMEYKKRINSLRKRYGLAEGDDQQQSMSSISSNSSLLDGRTPRSAVLGGMQRPRLADRKWDSEIVGRTVTGKKKMIYNQKQANEKANVSIAKAMRELAKNRNTPLTESTVTPFLPSGVQTSW